MADLSGKRIAFLFADGVEHAELVEPLEAVKDAGADVDLVSLEAGPVQTVESDINPKDHHTADKAVADVQVDAYDGLVLPGGTANPDTLRADPGAVAFVKGFFDAGKPVAAICHGPWTLVEAGVVQGRTLTSYPSIQTDIRNAGGTWVDEEAHVSDGLVTSRSPDDLPAFCREAVRLFAAGAGA